MAIVRIANNNMVGALRTRADRARPRPARLHALRLRRRRPAARLRPDARDGHPARASCRTIPGQFSAFGFILTDARVDRHRTAAAHLQALRPERAPQVHARRWSPRPSAELQRRATPTKSSLRAAWRCAISARTTSSSCRSAPTRFDAERRRSDSGRHSTTRTRRASASASRARSSRSSTISATVDFAHAQSPTCRALAKAAGGPPSRSARGGRVSRAARLRDAGLSPRRAARRATDRRPGGRRGGRLGDHPQSRASR